MPINMMERHKKVDYLDTGFSLPVTMPPNRLLKKPFHGLFQPAKRKMSFSLCFIFQTHTACFKNGGPSMDRTQAVFQQPANGGKSRPSVTTNQPTFLAIYRSTVL